MAASAAERAAILPSDFSPLQRRAGGGSDEVFLMDEASDALENFSLDPSRSRGVAGEFAGGRA